MKILKSKRKENIFSLKIEVAPDTIKTAIDKAFTKLSKSAKIPGFRKGKIPRNIFEKYYGQEVLIEEGVMNCVNLAYLEAIKELDLEVIDYPKNIDVGEYKENTPITFTCEVDVRPEVKLGKYKGIKAKKTLKEIKEDDIEKQLENIKENYAKYNDVTRSSQKEDFIRCNIEATSEEGTINSLTKRNVGLKIGTELYGKEFDDNITNTEINETKVFKVTYPENYHDQNLAHKEIEFKVTITEIKEKVLTELTDEFLSTISKYKTLEELKTEIRSELEQNATKEAEDQIKNELLETVTSNAKTNIQPILIENEIDQSLRSFEVQLKRSGLTLERYKELAKKSEQDMRTDFTTNAEKAVKTELVLDSIAEKEKIMVSDTDLEEEIKNWKLPNIKSEDDIKKQLQKINQKELIRVLQRRKALDLILENAKIT